MPLALGLVTKVMVCSLGGALLVLVVGAIGGYVIATVIERIARKRQQQFKGDRWPL